MGKIKKFGTFGGVFTPSILTILGVIMYLRLPWIAGQAGLLVTLGIVMLAHLISVTTGLSVSSIATDKKVKAGGTYYMISRSLGLPIGGTLGLALFVGLSFSVSLYLIGFAESFLGYWGFEVTKDTIRLAGSIVLFAVTIITFVSTSLAIKSQYLIMAAIFLSLLSILFGNHQFTPSEPTIFPIETAAPFILMFGIFFPAVTGFEAGVSMSGDLQNPKKSIPSGTIAAIVIGLLVYIGLAFFFSYTVSPDLLENDPNALLKISYIPELVIAGIWGATLSSALGSILGAPRILQATSSDKITPKFFAKGYGALNEPRNALMLTFIIAEIGILIGELDIIARIVSMFFITTYGFLNLSCAIESWASSDFRPDFRIPKTISIIGSIACFIVMIQLDFIAMIGATILLGSLFLYLKKKELSLEGGDTWGSVWSSVVKTGLSKLSSMKTNTRNWRPNIILFSGGAKARPHLVELGEAISGKLGMISDFILEEDPTVDGLIKNKKQSNAETDPKNSGIFTNYYKCANVYDGIDEITRVFGFSGVEPNTVFMGWGRESGSPEEFAKLVSTFNKQDFNSLYLDFDDDRKFGDYKTIDIWWRGAGNNLSLTLSLVRYLTSSHLWRDAHVRFLIISQKSSAISGVYKMMLKILEDFRVSGEIKIINNEIERRKPQEIIKAESSHTDLTFIGIPELTQNNANRFVSMVNDLTENIGSTLLVYASSEFEDMDVGLGTTTLETEQKFHIEELKIPAIAKNTPLETQATEVHNQMNALYKEFTSLSMQTILSEHKLLIQKYFRTIIDNTDALIKNLPAFQPDQRHQYINQQKNLFIQNFRKQEQEYKNFWKNITEPLSDDYDALFEKTAEIIKVAPDKMKIYYNLEDLVITSSDSAYEKLLKHGKKISARLTKSPVSININFQELVELFTHRSIGSALAKNLNIFELAIYKDLLLISNTMTVYFDTYNSLYNKTQSPDECVEILSRLQQEISKHNEAFESSFVKERYIDLYDITNSSAIIFSNILHLLMDVNVNRLMNKMKQSHSTEYKLFDKIADIPKILIGNAEKLINTLSTDILLEENKIAVLNAILESKKYILQAFEKAFFSPIASETKIIQNAITDVTINKFQIDIPKHFSLSGLTNKLFSQIRKSLIKIPENIEIIQNSFGESVENEFFVEGDTTNISLRKLAEYYVESIFVGSVQQSLHNIENEISEFSEDIKDVVNLTNFTLQNPETDLVIELSDEEQRNNLLNNAKLRLEEITKNISLTKAKLFELFDTYFEKSFEPLKSYKIVVASVGLNSSVRKLNERKIYSGISSGRRKIWQFIENIIVRLLYKKSESKLFAEKVSEQNQRHSNISDYYNITESVAPKSQILKQLPYYYKKLFSGRASISKEFWIGRQNEITQCNNAVRVFREGKNGGLLISGERNYGKTSLSQHIAELNFAADTIFSLDPPSGGSIEPEEFNRKLLTLLNRNGDINDALEHIVGEPVLIINDLELWWKREPNGFNVIDHIMKLILRYGSKWFFIININTHAYKAIKKRKAIDQYFLSIIHCEPFDAEDLKNILLIRQSASNMQYAIGNTHEDQLSEIKIAKYFNLLFNYSQGNIGTALNGWLTSIDTIKDNTIYLNYPKKINESILSNMPDDWILIIIELLIHRRMNENYLLSRIGNSIIDANTTIHKLKRSGIVRDYDKNTIELNPYIEPFIVKHLQKTEIV